MFGPAAGCPMLSGRRGCAAETGVAVCGTQAERDVHGLPAVSLVGGAWWEAACGGRGGGEGEGGNIKEGGG
jgi:hypothetical protein